MVLNVLTPFVESQRWLITTKRYINNYFQIFTYFLAPKEEPASESVSGPSLQLRILEAEDIETESLLQASQSSTEEEVSIFQKSKYYLHSYSLKRRMYEQRTNNGKDDGNYQMTEKKNEIISQSIIHQLMNQLLNQFLHQSINQSINQTSIYES